MVHVSPRYGAMSY